MNTSLVVRMLLAFGLLLWLWPNIVHEPLHWATFEAFGGSAEMRLNWDWPAHPVTVRLTPVGSVTEGVLFMLMPSIVSLIIIGVLLRTKPGKYGVWTHFVLGTYLGFDLLLNIAGFQSGISDFRFLQVFPNPVQLLLLISVLIVIGVQLVRVMPVVVHALQEVREVR